MEEEAKQNDSNQLVFSSLRVRTMQDDLKNVQAPVYLPLTPAPIPAQKQPPVQKRPEKKEIQKPAEERKPILPNNEAILNQAKEAFEKKQYEETISLTQAIIQGKNASWLIGFKTKRLLNRAKEEVEKRDKLAKEKIREPQKIVSKTLPEPPVFLPAQPAPQPPKIALPAKQTAPAPPVIKPLPPPAPPQVPLKQAPQPQPVKYFPPAVPTTPISQPKIVYEQPKLIYGQPLKLKPEPKRHLKIGLTFGIPATIIILGIFGFIYYNFWVVPSSCQEGQINADCICGGQTRTSGFCCNNIFSDYDCFFTKTPEPLIETLNLTMNIDAQGASSGKILSDIVNAGQGILNETARIVALKMSDSPKKYATLDDLTNIFGIALPDNLKANTQTFNLLVYIKPATKEIRLALVLKQKDSSLTEQIMTAWETTMFNDMKPLILGVPGTPATAKFISVNYNGGLFRYKNLPTKTTTINYTIFQNLVIIGTSKNSIYYAYDSANRNSNAANP